MSKHSMQQVISEADRLYAGRADLMNVSTSIELLRNADAACYQIAWRLSRALFFSGQESIDAKVARSLHANGVEAGRRAAGIRSDGVAGHFWLGVNLALLAQLDPATKAAVHALQAKRALRRATTIDASYHGAGPLRVLARLQHRLPRLLGGGATQARANFERALGIAPANTITRIYLAELLFEVGETTAARSELEHVLGAPFDPDWAFEIKRDQQLAKEMMETIQDSEVGGK